MGQQARPGYIGIWLYRCMVISVYIIGIHLYRYAVICLHRYTFIPVYIYTGIYLYRYIFISVYQYTFISVYSDAIISEYDTGKQGREVGEEEAGRDKGVEHV